MLRLIFISLTSYLLASTATAQSAEQLRKVQEMRRDQNCVAIREMMNAMPQQIAYSGYIIDQIVCTGIQGRSVYMRYTKPGISYGVELSLFDCRTGFNEKSPCIKADSDYAEAQKTPNPAQFRTSGLLGTVATVNVLPQIPGVVSDWSGGSYNSRVVGRNYYVYALVKAAPGQVTNADAMEAFIAPLLRSFDLGKLQ
jgi:hypothetical protein